MKKDYLLYIVSIAISITAIVLSYKYGLIVAYGDSESHLNIAKRIVDSVTPGAAQLGGVWLPLPHLLMLPFIKFDFLWRTGLAGSIVSGLAYVIASVYLYKLIFFLTKNYAASLLGYFIFLLNPNILYIQTTPMTETLLISFCILSLYHFFIFLENDSHILPLILASFFALCASLSRYDGWFLVFMEVLVLIVFHLIKRKSFQVFEGKFILYSSLAFIGIFLWLLWNYLILGDPLYFTNSQYSAKSQQMVWHGRGELPAYKNIYLAFLYYLVSTVDNFGIILSLLIPVSILLFVFRKDWLFNLFKASLLLFPFIFYVITLYLGQSIIFIPEVTPSYFEYNLFNVRYGVLMVPVLAVFLAFFWAKSHSLLKGMLFTVFVLQMIQFILIGPKEWISLNDGVNGLSAGKQTNADEWLRKNYTGGRVILDDYARTVSVVKSTIPMQEVIYIGNKPYWDLSLKNPEKHVDWVVMQKDDAVWRSIYADKKTQDKLYKYFVKTYTSPSILIFKSNTKVAKDNVYHGVLTKK